MVDVDRLVADLAGVIHGTVAAVVTSADGLPLAASAGLPPVQAAQLATITAGITALTAGAAEFLGALRVRHTTIEMTCGVLVLTTLPDGRHLAVLTRRE